MLYDGAFLGPVPGPCLKSLMVFTLQGSWKVIGGVIWTGRILGVTCHLVVESRFLTLCPPSPGPGPRDLNSLMVSLTFPRLSSGSQVSSSGAYPFQLTRK